MHNKAIAGLYYIRQGQAVLLFYHLWSVSWAFSPTQNALVIIAITCIPAV